MTSNLPATTAQNVYKSNALIESSYKLGVIEQRILLTCLSQIRDRGGITDEVMYSVSVKDIGELADTDSKSLYGELAKGAQRLRRKDVLVFDEPNTGNKLQKVMETSWVQSCVYIPKEGRIELRFNRDMLPYLSELQRQFTKYNLSDVIRMTSANGIRMFELLVQYATIGRRLVSIEDLRLWLRLENAYPKIADLRRKVIEPAIAQVNEYSSLIVQCTPVYKNRKITHFDFKMGWKAGSRLIKTEADRPAKAVKKSVTESDISKYARPGESYEGARGRLETKLKRDGHLD